MGSSQAEVSVFIESTHELGPLCKVSKYPRRHFAHLVLEYTRLDCGTVDVELSLPGRNITVNIHTKQMDIFSGENAMLWTFLWDVVTEAYKFHGIIAQNICSPSIPSSSEENVHPLSVDVYWNSHGLAFVAYTPLHFHLIIVTITRWTM